MHFWPAGKGVKRGRVDEMGLATAYANMPWADWLRGGEAALMKRTVEDLKVRWCDAMPYKRFDVTPGCDGRQYKAFCLLQ